jgi:hypothetical protein
MKLVGSSFVAGGETGDDVELLCGFHIIAHRLMNTRRDFLSLAFKGSAMAAATAFLSGSDPVVCPIFCPSSNERDGTKRSGTWRRWHRQVFSEKTLSTWNISSPPRHFTYRSCPLDR